MNITCVGGGPAGLYLAILMKKANPHSRITVIERNGPQDTFGFGVVFSDQTLLHLREADAPTYDAITQRFAHWDDIAVHFGQPGQVITSTGHGFSGLSRQVLLDILQARCQELGVQLQFGRDLKPGELEALRQGCDLLVGSDGLNSLVRTHYESAFGLQLDLRPNRFVWLGTTFPFPAFTFYFKENQHGLWRVHAYRYAHDVPEGQPQSTFIVECTGDTFARSGLAEGDEQATLAYCEALFAKELGGHKLACNRSLWRRFPVVRCQRWQHQNVVLLGDAVHTAHFSIGSGTKLALEDSIALRDALLAHSGVPAALAAYEAARRPVVESLQRAAQTSLEWFENTERYVHLPPEQFAFSLLTRSLRVTHENLRLRDAELLRRVDTLCASQAAAQSGVDSAALAGAQAAIATSAPPPPMFTPFRLRELVLENRVVVAPMCQYSAEDGTVDDWHLVHLGSRAIGGAGLVLTEMTGISREGRISPGCAGLYRPEHVTGWQRIVRFVHQHSAAKIGLQLGHAGRKAATRLFWDGDNQPLPAAQAWPIVAASPLPYFPGSQVPAELDTAGMAQVINDYIRATHLAQDAGFDLLEVHMAHGYLLGSFLSPLTNLRSDDFGGSQAARARFPLQVLRAVRAAWPKERPISVRISATDWLPGGMTGADAVVLARWLKEAGADIISVSTGQTMPQARPAYGRLFQTPYAEQIRLEANVPTIAVGMISSYSDVNSIIAAGRADLVALARAHLYDPYWTHHAAAEQDHPQPWPHPYGSVSQYKLRMK